MPVQNDPELLHERMHFEAIGGSDTPVVGPEHPDAREIHGGFEGGRVIKLDGTYHWFPTERFGQPGKPRTYDRIKTRIAHWTSPDAAHWRRVGTLYESTGAYSQIQRDVDDNDQRGALWAFMPVFDDSDGRWHGFYVCYTCILHFGAILSLGRIMHAVSNQPGREGIGGPYEDVGYILAHGDPDAQGWEGKQAVDSFFPYRVGDRWLGFYGGAFEDGVTGENFRTTGRWLVGLAEATAIGGPWKRLPEGEVNPVTSLHPRFIENPIVSRLPDGTYLLLSDGGPDFVGLTNQVCYAWSQDGFNWSPVRHIPFEPAIAKWWRTMRTPLCVIPEGGHEYTMLFTAVIDQERFFPLGRVRLRLVGREG